MKGLKGSFVIALVLCFVVGKGQKNFFNVDSIREIKITFYQANWDEVLDSLYVDGNGERLLAHVQIDNEVYDSVGVRYKGFSSVSVNRDKNPFNIKLDYFKNFDHNGVTKLKLGNVIQDPSFLREVYAYKIANKYMPSPLANFAKVYVNSVYWGLYTSVESVEADFLSKHYGSANKPFFKCNPDVLDLTGENSNLSNTPGIDTNNYKPYYNKKSGYGWNALYGLIDSLNNSNNNLEEQLNIDQTLWMHAFNYAIINFDSYIGYAQNYYLYQDDNNQFNPIIWDLNMSFGSFRLTDASDFSSGFLVTDAPYLDPLAHFNSFSVYPRPLLRNLLNVKQYRLMFLAHLRTIIQDNFVTGLYKTELTDIQNLIDDDVNNDPNKFYKYSHFQNNLNNTVTDLIDYPGLTDLMDERTNYLLNYKGIRNELEIQSFSASNSSPNIGDNVWINVQSNKADKITLAYRTNSNEIFKKVTMLDDGSHNDGSANDKVFGYELTNINHQVQYYFFAENDSVGTFSPTSAAHEYHTLSTYKALVINEICASNKNVYSDPQGEFDDWIELYNNSNSTISLSDYYLSDNFGNPTKWKFSNETIAPNSFLIIWADDQEGETGIHTNFKLSSAGEEVVLTNNKGITIDQASYTNLSNGVTYGRLPNGTGSFAYLSPSPNAQNNILSNVEIIEAQNGLKIYPNPATNHITVEGFSIENINIYSLDGSLVYSNMATALNKRLLNVSHLNKGVYIIKASNKSEDSYSKIIIQ